MHTTRDEAITFLRDLLSDRGLTPRAVSLSLNKSPTYLADYMGEKASPKALPEDVRLDLAQILGTSQENLRYQRTSVKDSARKVPQDVSHAGNGHPAVRRTVEMRVDHILEELGRIKERLDRLETERSVETEARGKRRPRP